MKDEALKKAQHALEGVLQVPEKISMMYILDVVRFIREALAQQQREPVAWALSHSRGLEFSSKYPMQASIEAAEQMASQHMGKVTVTPLYTSPPARKPLTDEEIRAIVREVDEEEGNIIHFARAIESAHGIKE